MAQFRYVMKAAIFICLGFVFGGDAVKFKLPLSRSSRSDCSYSSDVSTSETSSTDSNVEYIKDENGRFRHLKKDDDLLNLKEKKKNKKNKTKLKEVESDTTEFIRDRKGGKQKVGFIWQKQFMEKIKGENENGFSEELEKMTAGIVREPINAGWWLFTFGSGKNSVSKTSFKFKTSLPIRVSLIDLFCRGDSFAVLDSGKLIAQSSRIPADRECEGDDKMVSPQEALKDGRWSSVVFELEAGDHEITLKTVDSPTENGGMAAIKFDHILPSRAPRKISRNKVCRGYNGLIVITERMSLDEAELACLNMKTDIARIGSNPKDDIIIRRSIKTCTKGESRVWAMDGVDDGLKVFGRDGKAIEPEDEKKEEKYPVLCRVRT